MEDLNQTGTNKTRRTKAQRDAAVRERERRALQLVQRNKDYGQIAEELGYADESGARAAVKRALDRRIEPEVEAWREVEAHRLLESMRRLYEMLEVPHVIVQFGKVVLGADSHPLRDTGAEVSILRELRMTSKELSDLRGLHAPLRIVVEEVTEDAVAAEMLRINGMAEAVEADLRSMGVVVPPFGSGGGDGR